MNSVSLSHSRMSISKSSLVGVLLSLLAFSSARFCRGDQPSSAPVSPPTENALVSALNQKANLGQYAEIEVPKGYRFIDADAAKTLLEKMNNPASSGLVGILIPDGGK